jgi:pimeloyl-ACP methyl ester carboxylesterase
MMRMNTHLLAGICLLAALLGGPRAFADHPTQKAPGPDAKEERFEWKSSDGLTYLYRVPENYDPEKGAGLTVILHGSNLTRFWGFANHNAKTFRPDDIVVSPDGTTSNGGDEFNFLGNNKDAKRLHALLEELGQVFKVTGTYLYGHSQGSFFALYYAGLYPEQVTGVLAHASGMWSGTRTGKKGHHQAIVLMHGTQDPVVPYVQSEGAWLDLRAARYPKAHLRSIEGWNHWPAEHNLNLYRQAVPNASQQLAWIEGMTTKDADRLVTCFALVADNTFPQRHDYGGTWQLAKHVEAHEGAGAELKKRAAAVAASIEALAIKHVDLLAAEIPGKPTLEAKGWIHHLQMFLRTFEGLPSCNALAEKHAKLLKKQRSKGEKHWSAYWKALQGNDPKAGLAAGARALGEGFLYHRTGDNAFLSWLERWSKDADKHKIPKKLKATVDTLLSDFRAGREAGQKAFDELNKAHGKLP